jgi:hypothetical protein
MARIGFGQFGKLRLGFLDTSIATFSSIGLNPGTFVNSGISFFGGTLQAGVARAAVNIGPPVSIPGLSLPFSLEVTGVSNFSGNTNQIGLYTCNGASIFNGTQTTNGVNTVNAATVLNGTLTVNGAVVINAATHINGLLSFTSSIVGITKEFDIPHPTKENHRLKHGCIEGPGYDVFYRGRLIGNNTIELPEYWSGLVNPETITVNFTPHTYYQELYVKSIDSATKVIVASNSGKKIDCSYIVFAERKDVDKLVVEYEGSKPKENSTINS